MLIKHAQPSQAIVQRLIGASAIINGQHNALIRSSGIQTYRHGANYRHISTSPETDETAREQSFARRQRFVDEEQRRARKQDAKVLAGIAFSLIALFITLEFASTKATVRTAISRIVQEKVFDNDDIHRKITGVAKGVLEGLLDDPEMQRRLASTVEKILEENGPTLRRIVDAQILHHPDFEHAVKDWGTRMALEVCEAPEVVTGMSTLMMGAIERPATSECVKETLRSIVGSEEAQGMTVDLLKNTLSQKRVTDVLQTTVTSSGLLSGVVKRTLFPFLY